MIILVMVTNSSSMEEKLLNLIMVIGGLTKYMHIQKAYIDKLMD